MSANKFKFFAMLVFALSLSQHANADDAQLHDERKDAAFTRFGDVVAYGMPIGAVAYSLIINDYDGTKEGVLTIGSAAALTYSLKYIVGRPRPYEDRDVRGTSFPSGHTMFAFAGASFIERRYGWRVGVPAYALAAATGYSREWSRHHYWSDVITGAAIGIAAGYIFTNARDKIQIDASANMSGGHVNFLVRF